MEQKIRNIIIEGLKEVIEEDIEHIDSDIVIFGQSGCLLDSMGLVALIVNVEEKIENEFGFHVILTNDKALSKTKNPFRTITFMTKYIEQLIKEEILMGKDNEA